jgi:hypothetical protein
MQWILAIDLSAQPCDISLSSVEANQVEVSAAQTIDLPLFSLKEELARRDLSPFFLQLNEKNKSKDAELGEEDQGSEDTGATGDTDPIMDKIRISVESLKTAIQALPQEWTAVSVIIPPQDHLALNLNLPFGDARNLDRIVDLEVQDVVPFELDEFLVQYSSLGPITQGSAALDVSEQASVSYDVHVGLMPRTFVRNILLFCKAAGIEPNIMTVPSSVLGSVYHLGRDFFTTNSAVIFNRGDEFSMAVFINGEVRVERVLYASKLIAAQQNPTESPLKAVFTALKLMLAAAERRYQSRVENVYILGREIKGSNLQQLFGRPIQGLQLKDFVKAGDNVVGLSALGAPFAADEPPKTPLSNFRTREFSFTPKFGEFVRAILGSAKYVKVAAIIAIASLAAVYGVRAFTISSIQNSLKRQITSVIPDFQAPQNEIGPALMASVKKMSDELGVLASPAKVTPLDALLEILRLFPQSDGITITSLKISQTKATITGIAPTVSTVEKNIGKALGTNSGVFSKITATPGSANQGRYNFSVELILSQ